MILEFTLLVIGLTCLWGGAELLVKNATLFSRSLGISPIIVGLTVISVGTSAPELVVSIIAAVQDNIGISIGNIVGSNIANIALILGVGALITPLAVRQSWLRIEVPFMMLVTLIFVFMGITGQVIIRFEALTLLLLLAFFLAYVAKSTLREMSEFQELQDSGNGDESTKATLGQQILYFIYSALGIGILITGSKLAVDSGTELAEIWGVSHSIIGLTLIALGTSLPELATTVVSAYRKEIDLAIGNVIGSNIFNLLLIGGVTPLIRPITVDSHLIRLEFPILIVLSLLIWPMMRWRWDVRRTEGVVLLTSYFLFIYFTVTT